MSRTFANLLLAFLVGLACLSGVAAGGPPPPGPAWRTAVPGLEVRAIPLGAGAFPAMHQVRLDPRRMRLGLSLASDRGSRTLPVADLRRAAGALAAVNASYFGREGDPLGYLREGDRLVVPGVATGGAFTGVLVVREGVARILHRGSFQPGRAQLALQAGPRLVAGGQPVEGLSGPARRRTGVAVDTRGRIVLYATDLGGDLTLEGCRDLLLGPATRGGIEPADVLNLDGGSSTGISVQAGPVRIDSAALTGVPVALTVLPVR